jgi:hypothetical protein
MIDHGLHSICTERNCSNSPLFLQQEYCMTVDGNGKDKRGRNSACRPVWEAKAFHASLKVKG